MQFPTLLAGSRHSPSSGTSMQPILETLDFWHTWLSMNSKFPVDGHPSRNSSLWKLFLLNCLFRIDNEKKYVIYLNNDKNTTATFSIAKIKFFLCSLLDLFITNSFMGKTVKQEQTRQSETTLGTPYELKIWSSP